MEINNNKEITNSFNSYLVNKSKAQSKDSKPLSWIFKESQVSDLKLEGIINNNIIKEYENWTYLLLNIINKVKPQEVSHLPSKMDNNEVHNDYATSIQNELEKIIKVERENFDLKKELICQSKLNKQLSNRLNQSISEQTIINEDQSKKITDVEKDNAILLQNINLISEELDYLCNSNQIYESKVDPDSKRIIELNQEILSLQKEQDDLLCISESNTIIPLEVDHIRAFGKYVKNIKNDYNKKRSEGRSKSHFINISDEFNFMSCLNGRNISHEGSSTIYSFGKNNK